MPNAGEASTGTFPTPSVVNAAEKRPCLNYDASTDQQAAWTFIAPLGITTPLTLAITYRMASSNTGNVVWGGQIEAITSGDATDLGAATSYDTINNVTDAVPASSGTEKTVSITLTNNDSIAAGDLVRVRIQRTGSSGSDTSAGDAQFLGADFQDAA